MRILFWCATLASLVHFAASSLGRPGSSAYAARCRPVRAIRLAETLIVLLYVAVVPLAGWDFPFSPLPAAIGLALAVAGVALCVWAKVHLKTNFTVTLGIKQDHALITSGPYALVRHPMYTGFLLQFLGGAVLYDSGATLLLLFLPFAVFFCWQSAAEEKLLVDRFGDAYRRYRLTTGRLLPKFLKGESRG